MKRPTNKTSESKDTRTGRTPGGNENGGGCIYEETRNGKTVYTAQIRWRDPDGRARVKRVRRSDYKEAKVQLAKLTAELTLNKTLATPEENAITVGDALDSWIADAKRRGNRASTLKQYEYARRYMAALENRRIIDLRRRDITDVIDASAVRLPNEQHKGGRVPKNPKAAPTERTNTRMPRLVHVVLKAALEPHLRMVREDLFPRRSAPKKAKSAKLTVWNADEVRRFLKATGKTRNGLLWRFAIETGMRQGEIIALSWEHVHGRNIEVVATYDRATKGVGIQRRTAPVDKSKSATTWRPRLRHGAESETCLYFRPWAWLIRPRRNLLLARTVRRSESFRKT